MQGISDGTSDRPSGGWFSNLCNGLLGGIFDLFAEDNYENRVVVVGDLTKREQIYKRLIENGSIDEEVTETEFHSNFVRTTHYRWWYFVPLNLFHQFRRIVNTYFLITLIICFAIPAAPVNPLTWFYGLLVIVLISMVKQGYEDYLRYVRDK